MKEKNKILEIAIGIITSVLGLASVIVAYCLNINKNPFAKPEWYIYLLYILGSVLIFVGVSLFYKLYKEKKGEDGKISVRQMTLIAMQSAITIILYYFAKFNLPFFPSWLDIQVSEIPALITSFIYGPMAGALVIFIRFLVKLPGTMTVGIGEFADLVLGLIVVIIAGSIYRKHKTLKGALCGTAISMGVATVVACILNWLVLIPAYIEIAGFTLDKLVAMMSYIPGVSNENFMVIYIFAGVLPFNIFRYIIVTLFTFVLYKKTHLVFKKIESIK